MAGALVGVLVVAVIAVIAASSGGGSGGSTAASTASTAASGTVIDTINVGRHPEGVAVGLGGVWVANEQDNTLSRLDPLSGKVVASSAVGQSPTDVAVGLGGVFVANRDNTVTRIDAGTGNPLGRPIRGALLPKVAIGQLWVESSSLNSIRSIDPHSGAVVGNAITLPTGALYYAIGPEGVWIDVINDGPGFDTAEQIDPKTSKVLGTPVRVGTSTTDIELGFGSVWIASPTDNTVTRIDAQSGKVLATIKVSNAFDIAIAQAAVWVTNLDNDTVTTIDPNSNAVDRVTQVGGRPTAIAADTNGIWVTNSRDNTVSWIQP
jgi:YVTN family beta-propeller protein